jgi:plastocyanin
VTGDINSSGTGYDYATIKYYPNGDTAWVRRYNGPGNNSDDASAIAVDGSGNVYVTGGSRGSVTYDDYSTIKYYPDGDTAWVRRYNGPGNYYDWASAIAVDGSGNVYVTGYSHGSGTGSDYATIKYYPDGDTAWVRRYNGPANSYKYDVARAIAVDGSGNVYVTGGSEGNGTGFDYATIKYVQAFSWVSIIDFDFVPKVDTVSVGDSVRWTNNGTVPHTSTSDTKGPWDSGTLNPGESFTFQFQTPGSYPYHCEFHPSMTGMIVVRPASDVKDETGNKERPSQFTLSQNYPNPFNQTTKIDFSLAKSGFVSLNIYDILGRKVRTLVSERLSSGYKSVLWDGKNDSGKEVASGIYFYCLKVGDFSDTKKLVLLK